ncbi:hypothetical protein LWF01_17535 [Saxibacter everestensis]|uniref:Uncharacterized protein n=1 Tax=Saxibacter everestensis TaxID=2909229 RepID=A0ABY8QS78_9MICO|nr:hypothetical protein LWF01_17535 [Brevibacteriaceae bacterium ZFBP1038]
MSKDSLEVQQRLPSHPEGDTHVSPCESLKVTDVYELKGYDNGPATVTWEVDFADNGADVVNIRFPYRNEERYLAFRPAEPTMDGAAIDRYDEYTRSHKQPD